MADDDSPVPRVTLERVERALALEPMLMDPSCPAATREIVHLASCLAEDVLFLARRDAQRAGLLEIIDRAAGELALVKMGQAQLARAARDLDVACRSPSASTVREASARVSAALAILGESRKADVRGLPAREDRRSGQSLLPGPGRD